MTKTKLDEWAEEYEKKICPEEDPSDIPWGKMCNQDFRAGFEKFRQEALKKQKFEHCCGSHVYLEDIEQLGRGRCDRTRI